MRSNTASALLSLAIAIYYGVFKFVLTDSIDNSGIDFVLAVMAMAHALYGLTLFFPLAQHHPRAAGFVSFLLFFVMSSYSFWITKDETNTYFALLVIVALLSGMYGWIVSLMFNTSIITLLIMIQMGNLSASENYTPLMIVIYTAVSIMTILLWTSMNKIDDENQPILKLKKPKLSKAGKSTGPNLSTDILINAITDGVAIVGSDGVIQTFNPSATTITGWADSEAIGLDHRSVLIMTNQKDEVYSDQINPITQSLISGEARQDINAKIQTRSKKLIEVDLLASPIKNGDRAEATVVIFRDVSKQRSEERQRAEFISTASHEMRTPVAAIEGYLALAMNEKVAKIDSAAKGYLEKAHASTQHLGKLFQDLLTAAKSEDGRLTNNPEVVEVGQLLDELIEGVRFTAEKKGLLMESDFGEGGTTNGTQSSVSMGAVRPLAYVFVDAERIREVITNLFDNAVKYTEEGKVTIGMHTEEKTVTIIVKDTGAGISKEDVPHLFQKFYRVDNSATRQVGGTGLGLFICRKIVELYNGRIWVESELGEGSSFKISLPKLSNERAQELMRTQAQKVSSSQSSQPTINTMPLTPVSAAAIPAQPAQTVPSPAATAPVTAVPAPAPATPPAAPVQTTPLPPQPPQPPQNIAL